MARLFGTDGVRGVANISLTADLAYKLGFAGALVLANENVKAGKAKILLGRDTRISGQMLASALTAGINAAGADVIDIGVVPTPGVAYLTKKYGCEAGVMISASHNSYEYNGIKWFSSEGFKLPDATEDKIEEVIKNYDSYSDKLATHENVGVSEFNSDAASEYVDFLIEHMGLDLTGLKVAMDCANGAAAAYAPVLYKKLGAEIITIGCEPDGVNINKNCGSTHLESLCELVKKEKCDIGVAFDGDADRFLCVDSEGKVVDGDIIMMIIANDMKNRGILSDNTLVVTVMSNLGLRIGAKKEGINLATTKVGDRYVLEEMLKCGYSIGGEQSGHVILLDHATTGDGMLTSLALLTALKNSGKTITEARNIITVLPQVLFPAYVKNEDKEAAMAMPELAEKISVFEEELGDNGRILVRPSGTEPQIRVMLEGTDTERISEMAKELVAVIGSKYSL